MVKIFIGNLSEETTPDELRSLFSQYGKISECSIVKNFGFVHMDSKTEAEEAIRELHQYELNGQPMNVELSRGKSRGAAKLHVSNIACSNQELRAKFEEFGTVLECDIVRNFAFVHMARIEDATEAINQLDNSAFKGKLMSVKLSTSRLRTAPGMGDRSGCYRCGQEGHWSKECPLDQNGFHRNGSEPVSEGYDAPRYGGSGHYGSYHPGYTGEQKYGAGYAPPPGYNWGSDQNSSAAGYKSGPGYEGEMRYGPPPAYSNNDVYRGTDTQYGAVPAYQMRRSPYVERNPYGVVDYYDKYRANSYRSNYYEEQRAVPLPATATTPSTALREHLPHASVDPYKYSPIPPPPAPIPSFYTRDRSPIHRASAGGNGYSYDHSRTSAYSTPAAPTQYGNY
ncbi:splicing factor 1 isoform 2-T2 [Synchiropus picturatus]